jgi:hypothetical protein
LTSPGAGRDVWDVAMREEDKGRGMEARVGHRRDEASEHLARCLYSQNSVHIRRPSGDRRKGGSDVTAGYKCVVTAIQILVALLPFYRQLSHWWRPGCCRSRPSHRQRVPGGRAAPTLQSLGFVEAPLAWTHAERGQKLSRGRQAAAASVEFEKLGQRGGTRG